jgi:hypothetical protein
VTLLINPRQRRVWFSALPSLPLLRVKRVRPHGERKRPQIGSASAYRRARAVGHPHIALDVHNESITPDEDDLCDARSIESRGNARCAIHVERRSVDDVSKVSAFPKRLGRRMRTKKNSTQSGERIKGQFVWWEGGGEGKA